MPNRPSRIVIPCYAPSFDGRYWLRYPNGDKPNSGAVLEGSAADVVSAGGALATAIKLGGAAADAAGASGGLSTSIRLGASAAVVVSSVASLAGGANSVTHGSVFTVNGSGFGAKSGAVNIYDNCAHGQSVTARWSGGWPNAISGGNATANLDYRSGPFTRSIGASATAISHPLSRGTHILAGGAAASSGNNDGSNIGPWKNFTKPGPGTYAFMSWYERADPAWSELAGSPKDDNYKWMAYSEGTTPYGSCWYAANWFGGSGGPDGNYSLLDGSDGWALNDDVAGSGLVFNDVNGHNAFGTAGGGMRQDQWTKIEIFFLWAASPNGRLRFFQGEGHTLIKDYLGKTLDTYGGGSTRNLLFGGYNRAYPVLGNWRYFADLKCEVDTNDGHIYLTNNSSWAASSIRVKQPYTSWSDTSIAGMCDGGALSAGTVYAHFRTSPWNTQSDSALQTLTLTN